MSEAPHPTDLRVGQRLRERRMSLRLSQERLGELLGVTYQQIQKYERGANRIGSSRLHDLCRILDVQAGYFFDEAPPTAPGGLVEAAGSFVPEAPAPATAGGPARGAADEWEALELVRAFNRIPDPQVRRRLAELAKALAEAVYRRGARDGGDT